MGRRQDDGGGDDASGEFDSTQPVTGSPGAPAPTPQPTEYPSPVSCIDRSTTSFEFYGQACVVGPNAARLAPPVLCINCCSRARGSSAPNTPARGEDLDLNLSLRPGTAYTSDDTPFVLTDAPSSPFSLPLSFSFSPPLCSALCSQLMAFCFDQTHGTQVRTECPASCGICIAPTAAPTKPPSASPTFTRAPTDVPTTAPSSAPSATPSLRPSSAQPSLHPSAVPSLHPSAAPTALPLPPTQPPTTGAPSTMPTAVPFLAADLASPSVTPSVSPAAATLLSSGPPTPTPTAGPAPMTQSTTASPGDTEDSGSGDDVTAPPSAPPSAPPAPYGAPTAMPSWAPTALLGDTSNEVDGRDPSERSDDDDDSRLMVVIVSVSVVTACVAGIGGVYIWRARSKRGNGGNERASRSDVVRMQRQQLALATIPNPTFDGPVPDPAGPHGWLAASRIAEPAADGQPLPQQTAPRTTAATSRPVYKARVSRPTEQAVGAHSAGTAQAQAPATLPGASAALYDTVTMVGPDGMGGSGAVDGGPVAPPRGDSLGMRSCTGCDWLNEEASQACARCGSHSYASPSAINYPLAGGGMQPGQPGQLGQPGRPSNSPANKGRIGIGHDYANPLGATKRQPLFVNPATVGHDYATTPNGNGGRPVYSAISHRPNLHSIDTSARPAGMSAMAHVGVAMIKRPEGLVIISVQPGGYGESRGLSTGKVVHTLNGANARAMQLQEFFELFEATLGTVDLELMEAVSRIPPQPWRPVPAITTGMGSVGLKRPATIGVDTSYDGSTGVLQNKTGYASARAAAPPRITSTDEPEYEEVDEEPHLEIFANHSEEDENSHLAEVAAGDDRGDGGGGNMVADDSAVAAQLNDALELDTTNDDTEV